MHFQDEYRKSVFFFLRISKTTSVMANYLLSDKFIIWASVDQDGWCITYWPVCDQSMMMWSNGDIFRITGPFCREFTGHQWFPLTKANDVELLCFLCSAPELTFGIIWVSISILHSFIVTDPQFFQTFGKIDPYAGHCMISVSFWLVISAAVNLTVGHHNYYPVVPYTMFMCWCDDQYVVGI